MEQHHPPQNPSVPSAYDAAAEVVANFPPMGRRARIDGWTPERQRRFCEVLADTGLPREAAAAVGMSPQSAYELRRRAEGKGFALAWNAARFLARQRLLDIAIERAVDGETETLTKDGEEIGVRKKQGVRHLLTAITKIDSGMIGDPMARIAAEEFDEYLDCMEADANALQAIDARTPAGETPYAAGHIRNFFSARQPDGYFDGRKQDEMVERLMRASEFVQRRQGAPMNDDFDPDDFDEWDALS